MNNQKKLLFFSIAIAVLATSIISYALWQGSIKIPSQGTVKTFGLTVTRADGGNLTEILWGQVEPNNTYTHRAYLRNDGNVNVTLHMITSNWQPNASSTYLTLTWNREGSFLKPYGTTDADLTLTVSPIVNGVTDFSFDIIIQAIET